MSARMVEVPGLYEGAPYAYAAVAPAGELVFTAGACPIDAEGRVVAPGDVAAQAGLAVENLKGALAAAGASLADVLKTTVYVAAPERATLVAAWNAIAARFAPARPPSTLLGVSVLGYPEQLVEIEAVAVAPAGAGRPGSSFRNG